MSWRALAVGARSAWTYKVVTALRLPTWHGKAQGNTVSKRAQNIGVRSTWIYKIVLALRMPGNWLISRQKNGCKVIINLNVNKKMLNVLIVREKNC